MGRPYIWGDNDPLYVDANKVASALVAGLRMEGDLAGDKVVGVADGKEAVGLRAGQGVLRPESWAGATAATKQLVWSAQAMTEVMNR